MKKDDKLVIQAGFTADGQLWIDRNPDADLDVLANIARALVHTIAPDLTKEQAEDLFNSLLLELALPMNGVESDHDELMNELLQPDTESTPIKDNVIQFKRPSK
ncbi:hypothetical protein [Lapidilactobacillus bayanensis]|uniref:hypothetical protein n=1 Tax=Lapidilactobacillus bayanensis TaxID=2485998 RepID=UPI000F79755A|nr:hypothetical protein [Lapidilactobacillus bayanensis]